MTSRKRSKSQRSTVIKYTHEPRVPQNWPEAHVSVKLTGDDNGECIEVTIHGVRHYLHSTTARELEKAVGEPDKVERGARCGWLRSRLIDHGPSINKRTSENGNNQDACDQQHGSH